MAFNDLIEALDTTCLTVFGEAAIFLPQTGEGPINITGITSPAPMEDVLTGGSPGTVVVYFFVRLVDITPLPRRGDRISYGTASYDIADVNVDRSGGAMLKLRRNS
jgi:hypothetical protein